VTRLRTESALDDVMVIDKISSMKQIAEEDNKKMPYALANKTKNAFYKTRYNMENKFNRTLSDSRQIITLMDKMQGKTNESPQRQEKEGMTIME
jgi:hypothetical protein